MMSGFTGKDSIIHHTRNSEARQADHDLLKNSTPSDATHLESTDNLKLEIKKAEEEVCVLLSEIPWPQIYV